jgi:lipopolysaccharide transport system ATP-binding protein
MDDHLPLAEPIIRLDNVSKQFEAVSPALTLLETVAARLGISKVPGPGGRSRQPLQVVRNVNLQVMPGECLGILGQNGSGKSTLLKLITRILRPTTGRITVRGRVSALLELGAGFHVDLTGRENIFLNASLLGLDRRYIEEHFDSVVAFSELHDFIDMPVKYYSSGMYMRLAFSIAVHVQPQVLIVDEILAVGDQSFQEKCINHIYEMKRSGVTIILVSHSLDIMRKLCTRLVWMEKGIMRASDLPEVIIQEYLASLHSRDKRLAEQTDDHFLRSGTGEVEITGVRFLDGRNQRQDSFLTGDPLTIEISYLAHQPVREPEFGLAIYRQDGVQVNGPNTQFAGLFIEQITGSGRILYQIKQLPLLPGNYVVSVAVHNSRYERTYVLHEKAYAFRVGSGGTRELFGLVEIPATWSQG